MDKFSAYSQTTTYHMWISVINLHVDIIHLCDDEIA